MKKSTRNKFNFAFSLVAAIGSLGTVIAVILTYCTLKEIQKQRIQVYLPELIIDNEFAFGMLAKIDYQSYYWGDILTNRQKRERENADTVTKNPYLIFYTSNNEIDTNHIKVKNIFDWSLTGGIHYNSFSFRLSNIGLGVAKNIKLDWSFDTLKVKKHYDTIQNIKGVREIVFYSKNVFLRTDKGVDIKLDDKYYNEDITFIKYLISAENEDKNSIEIKLPIIYLNIWSFLHISNDNYFNYFVNPNFSIEEFEFYRTHLEEFYPPLLLKISYLDINNIEYTKKYKITILSGYKNKWYASSFLNSKVQFEEEY